MSNNHDCAENGLLTRRSLLGGGAASLAMWGMIPKAAAAPGRDPRLLTVILRGGLDGLSMVGPVGDPDYVRIRQKLALTREGPMAGLPLDDMFVLNPAMPFLHELYLKGEALCVHAASSAYRGRSHFDGQDVLESGLPAVSRSEDGWLNRALGQLAHAGRADPRGLAMGAVVPLVMRGSAPVLTWVPRVYGIQLRDSTIARLTDLYAQTDPALAKALAEGLAIDRVGMAPAAAPGSPPPAPRAYREFIDTAQTAARFMSAGDGPRIGALSYNGWDTHAAEGVLQGQLATRLAGLDAAIKAFADGMGPVWKETVVLIVTEFGRTAHVNGTDGTDHGTGGAALMVGGAVKGGRIITKWPGLADKNLYESRDLAPTTDLRGVIKGILRDHVGVPAATLSTAVFPESRAVPAMDGLVAA